MSGICGAWTKGHGDTDIGPSLAHLERRGPDGTRQWSGGDVALGHTLLATTPEALVEKLPLTDYHSGCTITADARIDNREELIVGLGLVGETRTIGDGELILRAYLEWGEECPKHLLGDFAFGIWDPRAPHLFCARDHMGMRQFNYCHVPGRFFAFATEDTALLAYPAVPPAIDERKIGDFLADLECVDRTSTFFAAISRLPPAHSMTVDATGSVQRRYWQLEPGPRLELPSDRAYADAFMVVFTEAVRCRLRNVGGVGAMMSGGLDSSAVVATGAAILAEDGNVPMRTISAISIENPDCAETRAINRMLDLDGLGPVLVTRHDLTRLSPMLKDELAASRNPFEVHRTMLRTIYAVAREKGMKVVLDGAAGDVTLTSSNRVASLLGEWNIGAARSELRGEENFWRPPRRWQFRGDTLLRAAWVAFAPISIRSGWRRFRLSRKPTLLAPSLSRRVDFPARRLAADEHLRMDVRCDARMRAEKMVHPNLSAGRERFDQLAGSFGVESRDPFMDIRVLAFCLSLPAEQLQRDGWTKVILRRALDGRVPTEIAWRRGKEHLGWEFTTALLSDWADWDAEMRLPSSPLHRYLSKEAQYALHATRRTMPTGQDLMYFALHNFLGRFGRKMTPRDSGDEY